MAAQKVKKTRRRKERKNVEHGAAHIKSTFNNSIVTLTDAQEMLYHGQVQEH